MSDIEKDVSDNTPSFFQRLQGVKLSDKISSTALQLRTIRNLTSPLDTDSNLINLIYDIDLTTPAGRKEVTDLVQKRVEELTGDHNRRIGLQLETTKTKLTDALKELQGVDQLPTLVAHKILPAESQMVHVQDSTGDTRDGQFSANFRSGATIRRQHPVTSMGQMGEAKKASPMRMAITEIAATARTFEPILSYLQGLGVQIADLTKREDISGRMKEIVQLHAQLQSMIPTIDSVKPVVQDLVGRTNASVPLRQKTLQKILVGHTSEQIPHPFAQVLMPSVVPIAKSAVA